MIIIAKKVALLRVPLGSAIAGNAIAHDAESRGSHLLATVMPEDAGVVGVAEEVRLTHDVERLTETVGEGTKHLDVSSERPQDEVVEGGEEAVVPHHE